MNRKAFIRIGTGSIIGLFTTPNLTLGKDQDEPDPIKTSIVKEFVVAGHKDLNRVQEMLVDYPNLIYSRYDWGNGDFEEAIEGAGHLGKKDIANYLIERGARVNLFVLTMLGKPKLVIPILEEYPNLLNSIGPHGFTLLHHANVGGTDSLEIQKYLLDNGLTDTHIKIR